jgi:hypothetical protein
VAEDNFPPARDNPEVAHEGRDVNVKAIAVFAAGMVIAAVIIHVALYWLLSYYRERDAQHREPVTAVGPIDEPRAVPRLQVAPPADLAQMRAAEETALGTYGWIDRDKNIVRLPIERAMEIIAEKGLPVRNQQPREEKAAPGQAQSQKPRR